MFNPKDLLFTYIDNQSIQLVSIIGSGTFGNIYLGKYTYTNRYYAVKCVAETYATENEIFMHSILSGHANILSLEKVVRQNGMVFIIMEYATHGDLFTSITQPQFSQNIIGNTKVIRHLFLQTLDAVQHCHHNMIAHRDIKPENILLMSNHRVKLADFGFSTTELSSNEFNLGSSFYFSPECQGISLVNNTKLYSYDAIANDVWSLGVVLINLVSGRNPWKQANLEDPAFASYVNEPRKFFRTILPDISKSLESILRRIFCLDPVKRISLTELRTMILGCRSFTNIVPKITTNYTKLHSSPQQSSMLECSKSFESTVMTYIGNYIDDGSSICTASPCYSGYSSSSNTTLEEDLQSPIDGFYNKQSCFTSETKDELLFNPYRTIVKSNYLQSV